MTPIACPGPDPSAPIVQGLADYVGCHAQALGEVGFKNMAGGVLLPTFLSGCLVLYIAAIGFRVLTGQRFDFRDLVLASLRAGLVITFCLSWTSYSTVVSRVVNEGPAELVATVLQSSDLPVLTLNEAASRLEGAYDAIERQSPLSPNSSGPNAQPSPGLSGPLLGAGAPPSALGASHQSVPLNAAGVFLLASSVGSLIAVKLAAGVFLAVGPLIVALALFDSMIGLLEGWIRALLGAAFGAFGVSIVIAVEIAFLEGEANGAADAVANLASGLMVVSTLFALAFLFVLAAAVGLARGFRLFPFHMLQATTPTAPSSLPHASYPRTSRSSAIDRPETQSRAQTVADAIMVQGRRERHETEGYRPRATSSFASANLTSAKKAGLEGAARPEALGSSFRRSVASRRSASFERRERRR